MAADVDGPGTSTGSTLSPGAAETRADATLQPAVGVGHHAHDTSAVGADPGGDGRPLGAQPDDVLAGQHHAHRPAVLVGQAASSGRRHRRRLAAEGAPVGERRCRLPAGLAPRRVRLQVAGLHPRGLQGQVPVAGGQGHRPGDAAAAPPPLHLAGGGPGRGQRLAQRPLAAGGGHRHQASGGGGVVGKAAPTADDVGAHPLGDPALQSGSPGGGGLVAPGHGHGPAGDGVDHGPPPGTAAQMGQQRRLHLLRTRPLAQGGRPAQDPGRAEPTLAGAGGDEGADQPVTHLRLEAVHGDDRPSRNPPQRRDAGDAGGPVDQHGATSALSLRAAAVLDAAYAQIFAQSIEERCSLAGLDVDGAPVDG